MSGFIPHVHERNNFKILLGALVFFMVMDSVADQFDLTFTQRFVNLVLMITLVINVWAVDNPRTNFISWKWGATMVISVTMITDTLIDSNFLAKFQVIMVFLFVCLTTWQAWSQVMFTGIVDTNKIVGAICIYLLLAMAWAFAYQIVEAFLPGSVNGLAGGLWQEKTHTLIYYSFVTISTLGYGEITPVGPIARTLATLEAVTGIFYTTVLVASLIGIRLSGVDSHQRLEELGQKPGAGSDGSQSGRAP